jgi:hypothetical protein
MNALNAIPEGVLRIYCLVASNEFLPRSTLFDLGRLRALSMVFWHFMDKSSLPLCHLRASWPSSLRLSTKSLLRSSALCL